MSNIAASILGGFGRLLIAAGLITLAFASFQLWGTSLAERQGQEALDAELAQSLLGEGFANSTEAQPEPASEVLPGEAESDELDPPETAPDLPLEEGPSVGQPFGRIKIPKIEIEKVIVEGVNRDDLRQAPGHYPDTPLPGQVGNASIAGHRTTYGQPFHNLDKLLPGDKIEVETMQGEFTYIVEGHPVEGPDGPSEIGHQIVLPGDVDVIGDKGDNRLTLTACHPKYSAKERIIVSALLISEPALQTLQPKGAVEPVSFEDSLGWQPDQLLPTTLWGLALGAVFAAAWLLGRFWRQLWAYLLAAPVFIVVMLVWFSHIDHLIPAV